VRRRRAVGPLPLDARRDPDHDREVRSAATSATSDSTPADGRDHVPSTLVVPLDGSDYAARAMPVARDFAARFDAEVVVVTTPHSIDRSTWGELPAWLAELVAAPAAVPVRGVVADTMEPADAVLAELAARPDAAVCMATHARGALGSGALGNVAREIVDRAGAAVVLVGRHCQVERPAQGPVVVAHDGSHAADAVLAPARAWALGCGLALVLVHAHHPLDAATPTHPDAVFDDACRTLGPDTRLEIVSASFAAGAIRDLAHELDASLIALATHGHSGAAAVSMGRVASWVIRESGCPVLAVRPTDLRG
jgi:nucleotide-binding universal stress UspA family protein